MCMCEEIKDPGVLFVNEIPLADLSLDCWAN